METRAVVALVLLVAVAGALPFGAAAAAQTQTPAASPAAGEPTITVDVDGAPLDPGDVYRTAADPWIRVRASANASISLVEVRVDGTTRHVFEPSSESVDRNVVLDLETGRHRVTVVAKAEGVATHEATIVRDDVPPTINYSSPFAADATPESANVTPADELTVERANVSINGTLTDLSAVETVRIDHDYSYRLPDESDADRQDRRQHLLSRPGERFDESLYLAPGDNEITITAEDAVGNVRTHEFTVSVDDETAPTLTVTDVEWVSETRLHIEGRASDRVQVQSVWLDSSNASDEDAAAVLGDEDDANRHPLVFAQSTAPDRDRRTVAIDTTVYHPPDTDYVVVGTTDTAGNERTWNYSLSTFLAPNVTITDRRTGYVGDRTVAVGGTVSGGQVANASVETVDPDTGRLIDIRPVDLGANGTFGTRLDAAPGETRIRVRVRDASGAEHLTAANVSEPAPDPPDPPAADDGETGAGSAGNERGSGDEAAGESEDGAAAAGGFRVPLLGVVVPVPDILAVAVSVPLPVVGPVDVPLVGVGVPALVAVVAGLRRR